MKGSLRSCCWSGVLASKTTKTSRCLFQEESKAGIFAARFIGFSKKAKEKGQDDQYYVYIVGLENRFLGFILLVYVIVILRLSRRCM